MSLFVLFLIPQTFLYLVMSSVPLFSGQARRKPAQEPLQHDVTVTLKLVQVFVTDPDGHPARDLDKSDFVLYDNGELQEITGFEKHFLFAPRVEPEKISPPEEPAAPSLMNRKFIFLIDYENNDLVGAAKARNAITQFMDTQVQPEDELALFSFSAKRGLVLHEYFTSDHQKIRAGLRRVLEIPNIGGGWERGEFLGQSVMGMEAERGVLSIVKPPTSLRTGMYEVANALSETAKALRHIPGQKNIILFSRGFGRAYPGHPAWEAFVAMSKELATANTLVFSVNTMTGWEKIKLMPEDSLALLSTATGGKYSHDVDLYSNNAEDIQEVTSNYYVLGYSIESTWDGRFHDLKVEVKRPGYKVRAQKGYFNPLPFNKLSPVEKHFHLLDIALGEKAEIERHLNFPLSGLAFSDSEGPNTFVLDKMTGEEIAIPLMIIKEDAKEHMKTFLIRFQVPDLEPDEYTLFLVATYRSDGEMSAMGCDYVIE